MMRVGDRYIYVLSIHRLLARVDIVSPIEREVRSLSHGLTSVKDEQEYIVVRERTHRDTAESTNERVKWWSILQAIVLFSVVAWQVWYLKVWTHCTFHLSSLAELLTSCSRSSRSNGHSNSSAICRFA